MNQFLPIRQELAKGGDGEWRVRMRFTQKLQAANGDFDQ
jgi:hypothetical protein